nr:MAG TPA: hypothetical protein [Caudoviricetes sp.]
MIAFSTKLNTRQGSRLFRRFSFVFAVLIKNVPFKIINL